MMFNKGVMARSEQRALARRMDDKTLIRAKNHFNDFWSHQDSLVQQANELLNIMQ